MNRQLHYGLSIEWTGNRGTGTSSYTAYDRSHTILIDNKTTIEGSSDFRYRGDQTKHNPEEFLLAAISACHMLWYLHLCSEEGVIVANYIDNVTGIMVEKENGGGHFKEATLHPTVTLEDISMEAIAKELHKKANELCFIANSLNFPVYHKPAFKIIDK